MKKDERKTLKIPADLHKSLKIAAAQRGATIVQMLRDLIGESK